MDKKEQTEVMDYINILENRFGWLVIVSLVTFLISLSPYLLMLEQYLTGIHLVNYVSSYPLYPKYVLALVNGLLIFIFVFLFLIMKREVYRIAPSIASSLILSVLALALALILAMAEAMNINIIPRYILIINNYVYNLAFFVAMYFVYITTSFVSEIRPFRIKNKIFSGIGIAFLVFTNSIIIYMLVSYGIEAPKTPLFSMISLISALVLGLVLDTYLLTRFINLESIHTLIDLADLSLLTIMINIVFNEVLMAQLFLSQTSLSTILMSHAYYMGIISSILVSILVIISVNMLSVLHIRTGTIRSISHILVEADFNKPVETYEKIVFFLSLLLPGREKINFILATRPGSLIAEALTLRFPKSRITRIDIIPGKSSVSREYDRFEAPPSPVHLLYAIREALDLVGKDELPVLIIDTLTDIKFLIGDINTYTFLRNLVSKFPDLLSLYIVNREAHTPRETSLFRSIINRVIEL